MFCSVECREEFYKYADFTDAEFDRMEMLKKKIEAKFGGSEKYEAYLLEDKNESLFDFDFSDNDNYQLNIFKCLLSARREKLNTDDDQPKEEDDATTAPDSSTSISDIFLDNAKAYTHVNIDGFYGNKIVSLKKPTVDGAFFSSFLASLSQSCAPNLDFFCIENMIVVYVKRPIHAYKDQLSIAQA
jgi:hypothetical protein